MENNFMLNLVACLKRSESRKQLNSDMKELEKVLNKLKLVATFSRGETKKELNAYIKSLGGQLSTLKLQAKLDNKNLQREINSALNKLTFKDIDVLNIDGNKTVLKVKKVIADAQAYASRNSISVNIETKKEKLQNQLSTFLNKNSKIRESGALLKEAENVRTLIEAVSDKKTLTEATDAFQLYKSEVTATGYASKSTTDKIKGMLSNITKIGSAFGIASLAVNNFRKSLATLKENDTILTEISKTSEMTKKQLVELGNEAFKVASKYGQTSGNYLLGVQEMARSGYESLSKELGELSLLAQSAGDMAADDANNYLLATDAAYKYEGSIQKLNAALDGANFISNKNSASLTDIADGVRVSASFAANAGVAIDELTAAEATMIATTKRSGSEMGRAFRSIILNLQQVSGEFDGEVIDEEQLKKVEDRCHSLGVELEYIKDGVATLRNPMEVLKELAEVYNSLPDNSADKQGLISDLGGKYYANALSSLLSRWDLYEKMLAEYSQGTGSALEEANKTALSWEGRLNSLQNSWNSLINSITNKEAILNGVSFFDRLIQGAEGAVDILGEIPVVLTTIQTAMVALNKDYGITQLINPENHKLDIQGNAFGIDFTAIKDQKKHFAEAAEAIQLWNDVLANGTANIDTFGNATVKNSAQLKAYLATCSKEAPASLAGYRAYLAAAGETTDILRLKTILLNSALTFGLSIAIQLAITGITKLVQSHMELAEKTEEATKEAIKSYESITSEVESLESKIEDLNDQIGKLDPITDAEDIENLKAETAELETQLKILQEKQRLAGIDADEKAQESLGMKETSRYIGNTYDSQGEIVERAPKVTKTEELQNAIDAYYEYEDKVNGANDALAKMAETGEYTQKEWDAQEKIVSEYSQKMEDARSHANELATTIGEQKDALTGDTEASKSLKDSVESSLGVYDSFLDHVNGVTVALEEQAEVAGEVAESATSSVSQTIDQLNTQLKPVFDSLKSAYNDIFTDDGFTLKNVDISMLDSIKSSIDELNEVEGISIDYSSFDELAKVLTDTASTSDDVHTSFNALAKDIVTGLNPSLSQCSGETYTMVQRLLESVGIINSEEVMISLVGYSYETYTEAKKMATEAGFALEDATLEDINALLQEQDATDETRAFWARYLEQKILANSTFISTSGDISALAALCTQLGVAGSALSNFARLKAEALDSNLSDSARQGKIDLANRVLQNAIEKANANITTDYQYQAPKSSSGSSGSGGSSKSAEKEVDIMSELNSKMDEYQSKLKAIKEARETYNEHVKISIDQAKEILDADFKLLAAYGDEESALKDLGKAKLNEMQIQLARNAIDTINSITSEAEATQYLAGANANLAGTSLAATEAMLQQAVAAAKLRGEMQGAAAETILQGYQNGAMMLGQVDFSFDSSEVEKTALDKFKDWFSTLFDWIEVRIERLSAKIDKSLKKAASYKDYGWYGTASQFYDRALNYTYAQVDAQQKAAKKYKQQAQDVLDRAISEGLISSEEAKTIADNVKNGSIDISEYSDEMKDVISSYQEWTDKARKANDALQDLHDSIRDYIKDLKDLRDTQRDTRLDYLSTKLTIGTSGNTSKTNLDYRAENSQLEYTRVNLTSQNAAYDKEVAEVEKDNSKIKSSAKKSVNDQLKSKKAKGDSESAKKYRTALDNAKKAIAAKQKVKATDMKVIKSHSLVTYENLYAYNLSLENAETAKLEQATNYAATQAERYQNIAETYENMDTASNNKISLAQSKSENATSAKEANHYLDSVASEYDTILSNDRSEITRYSNSLSKAKKTVSSDSWKSATFDKQSESVRAKVNSCIQKAKDAAKAGTIIDASVIADLGKYYSKGYITYAFLQACISYNEALEYKNEAEAQLEIDKETAIQEKASIGTQKFSNVEQEYANKQTVVSDRTAMIQAKQSTKTTRGLSLNESDYNALLSQSKAEQKIYADEIIELQKTIKENLASGYWTTANQEYLDAVSAVNAYEVKVQECTTAQEEFNNAIAKLPYDTIERALDLLDAVADYNKSLAELKAAASKDLSEDDYLRQMQDNNDKIKKYQEERLQAYQDYQKALANADKVYGGKTADEWLAEYNQFGTTINNLKADNESLKDSLRDDVYWRDFERAHQAAERLQNVVQGLADLISNDMLYDSDGRLTEYGVTKAANLVKQYELAREEVQNYTNDIKNLNALYADGQYEEEEYKEKLNELQTALLDSTKDIKSYSDSIIDMYKNMAKAELDALYELIDARNEALQKKKEYHSYDKSIRDKNKNIQSLKAEIAALEGVAGAEAKAKKAKLEAELSEAQEDLNDTLTEHQFELSQDALADMKDVLQDAFDEKWDHIAGNLDEMMELMNAANELTAGSASMINDTLNRLLQYYGVDPVTTGIDAAYASGTNGVSSNMLRLTKENGEEILVSKDGAMLIPVDPSDLPINPEKFASILMNKDTSYNTPMPQIALSIPEIKIPDIDTSKMGTVINQHYDSLINIEGSADAVTVEQLKKLKDSWKPEFYEYTCKKAYNGYLKAGGKHRI